MSTLDNFRRDAKRWLRALREHAAAERIRFERAYPGGPREPALRDVQHALAREHGFENWVALKAAHGGSTSPTLAEYERLAQDLAAAYQTGEPAALERIRERFKVTGTWEDLRASVDARLASLPAADVPAGPFALPHARLVIARQLGAKHWVDLAAVLSEAAPAGPVVRVPPRFRPDTTAPMIEPVEIHADLRVRMRDGTLTTTRDVWRMLNACRTGDLDHVAALASGTPGLVLCDYNYMPPLHLAVREGHLGVVTLLCERGAANPNHVTYPYREKLTTVARDRGYEAIAALLDAHCAREDQTRPEEEGGEFEYVRDEDRVRFQKRVNLGALAEVEAALERRPELALDDFAFWSEGILSMPANRGNRPMLELLLRSGAAVPEVTKWGAWYYFKRFESAAFLLEHGMSARHMNCHHTTVLHDMAYTGDARMAGLLLDNGAEIDAIDEEWRSTPLGLAARFGRREVVDLLLARGADPARAGAEWATPLEWARTKGHADIVARLRIA